MHNSFEADGTRYFSWNGDMDTWVHNYSIDLNMFIQGIKLLTTATFHVFHLNIKHYQRHTIIFHVNSELSLLYNMFKLELT